MPLQLIFTSAPRGLTPGRSGFCTVARHQSIPERLTQILESIGTPHESSHGATFSYRIIESGGQSWYVISRFVARGLDYSQRNNRLAHHLVFSADEITILPPPAAIALRWKGWIDEWKEGPTWLSESDESLTLESHPPLTPASGWRDFAGSGAKAAWLVGSAGANTVALRNPPDDARLLRLLAESAALLGRGSWYATFTTNTAITGPEGFHWAVGTIPGRTEIDFNQAKQISPPTGDFARQAATGIGTTPLTFTGTTEPATEPSKNSFNASLSRTVLIIIVSIIVVLGLLLFLLFSKSETPTPAPVVETPPTPLIDTTKSDELYRANIAIKNISNLLESNDYIGAAKLWIETSQLSPTFAQRYQEQYLTRLQANYVSKVVLQLRAQIENPNVFKKANSTSSLQQIAREAIQTGESLQLQTRPDWPKLLEIQQRIELIGRCDVRPLILITGQWSTADVGPNAPSTGEFKLSANAAEKITKFIEASGASAQSSLLVQMRVLPLETFFSRDDKTKFIPSEIRRSQQASWIETSNTVGRAPIEITVGTRRNTITLNFPDGTAKSLNDHNCLIEIMLPDGNRQGLAVVSNWKKIRPLNLGLAALEKETDTGVVHLANWAEPAILAFIATEGSIGLFPADHEFPDRDLASLRATRSLLETDLIRLEKAAGPNSPSYDHIKSRRQKFTEGDFIQAGAPWTAILVSPKGEAISPLLEFK